MSNRIYEIVEEIATLSGTGRSKRKVRRIRWDNSPDSVLDIRKWFQEVDGTETPCKGIKLDAAEEAALREAPSFVRGKQERNVLPEAFLFIISMGRCNESFPRLTTMKPTANGQEIRSLRSLTSGLPTNPTLVSLSGFRTAFKG